MGVCISKQEAMQMQSIQSEMQAKIIELQCQIQWTDSTTADFVRAFDNKYKSLKQESDNLQTQMTILQNSNT
jgi:hypothetical protein